MKIDDRISNYMSLLLADSTNSANPASKAKENGGGQQTVSGTKADNVTISPVAAQLGDDEAHHERLLAIKRQLSEGTYNISGKDVATKIIKALQS